MQNFRTYHLAKALYKKAQTLKLKGPVRDQFHRAMLSIPLNLAEGSAKSSKADRKRFYEIALGSLKEVRAIIDLEDLKELDQDAKQLGAHLYCLVRSLKGSG